MELRRPIAITNGVTAEAVMAVYMPLRDGDSGRRLSLNTSGVDEIIERNIRALVARRKEEEAGISRHEQLAIGMTRFIGSISFIYVHLLLFGLWSLINTVGIARIPKFDPELFYLAGFAAIEAIFLSTLVLIAQNRMTAAADKRSELDLQISLLTEHELTRLIAMVCAVADRLGAKTEVDSEIEELKRDVQVHDVLDKIETVDENEVEGCVVEKDGKPRKR